MPKQPFFSVITPSFNQGSWIEGCIQSVLAQGVEDFEHIICDNCSTDQTVEILRRYPHLRWTSEPDNGQAHALNKALGQARGEVICWLNSDDQYPAGTFEIVRRELSKPGVDVIFGDAREIYFDGRPAGVRKAKLTARNDMLRWWEKRVELLQPAVFLKRTAVEKAGPLREDLFIAMDLEYWWRVSQYFEFRYLPVVLAIQQRQPDSKTVVFTRRMYEEKERVFAPLLHEAYPRERLRLNLERRAAMGRRWLSLAQFAGPAKRQTAREFLGVSLRENPLLFCSPSWWRTLLHSQLASPRPRV